MDSLKEILTAELEEYAEEGINSLALPIFDEKRNFYALVAIDYPTREDPGDLIILARLAEDKIIIEEDMTDKKLVDALLQRGISREKIVLAYEDEASPPVWTK